MDFESKNGLAHTTSCSTLVEIMRLSCTVFELLRVICQNSSILFTPLAFVTPVRCDSVRISSRSLASENYIVPVLSCGVTCVILCLAVLIQYRRMTDRRTDGRTDTRRRGAAPSIASRGKNGIKRSKRSNIWLFCSQKVNFENWFWVWRIIESLSRFTWDTIASLKLCCFILI